MAAMVPPPTPTVVPPSVAVMTPTTQERTAYTTEPTTSPFTTCPASRAVGEKQPNAAGIARQTIGPLGPRRQTEPTRPKGTNIGPIEVGWFSYTGHQVGTEIVYGAGQWEAKEARQDVY